MLVGIQSSPSSEPSPKWSLKVVFVRQDEDDERRECDNQDEHQKVRWSPPWAWGRRHYHRQQITASRSRKPQWSKRWTAQGGGTQSVVCVCVCVCAEGNETPKLHECAPTELPYINFYHLLRGSDTHGIASRLRHLRVAAKSRPDSRSTWSQPQQVAGACTRSDGVVQAPGQAHSGPELARGQTASFKHLVKLIRPGLRTATSDRRRVCHLTSPHLTSLLALLAQLLLILL